ncbi:MAG: TIGR04255 family protein [Verrucomicrobiales bacterium]|nr:TIGR04255 family protein [Verrucomicrobiales bacterium]
MTIRPELTHKPLVESIFEIRWELTQPAPGVRIDPFYRLLPGRLHDRIQSEYQAYEQLPTAMLSDDMVPQMVQHRFRKTAGGWPLIQIGPGLMTVNETQNYVWDDFRQRCEYAVATLWEAYPKSEELRVEAICLRYLNAVDMDPSKTSAFDFLRENMGVGAGLPESLFESGSISPLPIGFSSRSRLQCSRPKGNASVQFDTGLRENRPVLRWETTVISSKEDVPSPLPDSIGKWLHEAHEVIDDCFYALVPKQFKSSPEPVA